MTYQAPPSFERRATALTIATLAAVLEISVISCGADVLTRIAYQTDYRIDVVLWFLPLLLFLGAIIAVPLCWLIGLPLWHLAICLDRQSRRDATYVGLATGAVIGTFVAFLLSEGTEEPLIVTALPPFLLFCLAGTSSGWIAHRIGYRR